MNLNTRIQHWLDFYRLDSTRQFLLLIEFEEDNLNRPWPNPDRWNERMEWAWQKYENQVQRMDSIADDRIPFLDTFTGTEIFAQAFGCSVHYPEDNMPFALPLVDNPKDAEHLKIPALNSPPLKAILDAAQQLYDRSGQRALLRLPDVQTPMDITALILEKKFFYSALVEYPEVVLEVAHKVQALQFQFFDEWFHRFGPAFIAHYPDYYMPCGITVSEDEVGAISSRMYTKFFQKELHALAERYGKIGIHCCANAEHQWEHFAAVPNLILLNLVQPMDVLERSYETFARICAQYPSALPNSLDALTTADLPQDAHFVFHPIVKTRAEAQTLVEHFRTHFQHV